MPGSDRGRQVDREVRRGHVPREGREAGGGRVAVVAAARGRHLGREGDAGGVAGGLAEGGVAAPLDAHVAEVAARRLDDARLDQHLRGLRVERADQLLDVVQDASHVAGDQRVGALVDGQGPARREEVLRARLELRRRRVVDGDEARLGGRELELGALLGEAQLALLLQLRQRGDADQVSLPHHPEPLRLEHHVERLVPRDVTHADGDVAAHVVGGDDVDAPDVRQEAEDVVDVGVLEVEVDASPGEAPAACAAGGLRLHAGEEARLLPAPRRLHGHPAPVDVAGVERRLDARRGHVALLARDGDHLAVGAGGPLRGDRSARRTGAARALERPHQAAALHGDVA